MTRNDWRTSYARATVWVTDVPFASVSSTFSETGLPAAPAWSTTAVAAPSAVRDIGRIALPR
ncbi:hypothetical protein OG429_29750 [Streptomyces sp. NBC_00190]|uniref:hypothetical protein n=1 Tax=unclassified Streptomyces TaxID=2593676 RepID=UPI002E2D8476|nr:hypothetical protein [Streptomyces sp. NBC_00190]